MGLEWDHCLQQCGAGHELEDPGVPQKIISALINSFGDPVGKLKREFWFFLDILAKKQQSGRHLVWMLILNGGQRPCQAFRSLAGQCGVVLSTLLPASLWSPFPWVHLASCCRGLCKVRNCPLD